MSEGNEMVRTREEQISALWDDLSKGKQNPNHDSYSDAAAAHIDEAEARGAAEQRRKDGEGQEPVYQMKGSGTLWVTSRNKKEWEEECFQFENFNIPGFEKRILYTHPTNVAALEDRVRELEEENADLEVAVMKAAESVMGIETPCMDGDNLAVTICSHFEDSEGEPCDNGWYEGATNAYEEIKIAVIRHFRNALKREGTPS